MNQIVSLPDGSVIIRNDFGNLFKTTDAGKHWRKVRERLHRLAVSDGKTLWSFLGWPGVHEAPTAEVWRSGDSGETWSEHKFPVPVERTEALYSLLPAAFANQPGERPLVMMYNLQLKRPEPWGALGSWSNIGTPVPIDDRAFSVWHGAAIEYRGTLYAAVGGSCIFMSKDVGKTWTATSVPYFEDSVLKCSGDVCFSLLTFPRSEGNAPTLAAGSGPLRSVASSLFSTKAGAGKWTTKADLSVSALSIALKGIAKDRPAIHRFQATALVASDDGVYVAGIVNSPYDCLTSITGKDCNGGEWGVVLWVGSDDQPKPVGKSFDEGIWSLERDSRGMVWAGGKGVFQLLDGTWVRVWQDD